MTQAALGKAVVGLVRGLQVVSTIAVLATLASDLKGAWTKDAAGKNQLQIPASDPNCLLTNSCAKDYSYGTVSNGTAGEVCAGIFKDYNYPGFSLYGFVAPNRCRIVYTNTAPGSTDLPRNMEWVIGVNDKPGVDNSKPTNLSDDQIATELQRADKSRLIPVVKQLDDAGTPVVFPDPKATISR